MTFHLWSGMSGLHLQDRKTLVFSNHQSDKGIDGTIGNRAWPSLNGGSLEIIIVYLTSLKITCWRHFIKLVKSHFFMWKSSFKLFYVNFVYFYLMQTDPLVDFLLSYRIHSLKYLRSTTWVAKIQGL